MREIIKILATDSGTVKQTLENNLPNTNASWDNFVPNILNWAYGAAGLVAVGFIIFAAWKYMSANGDPGKITSATKTILFSVIGLIIVLLAAAITNFVIFNVGNSLQ